MLSVSDGSWCLGACQMQIYCLWSITSWIRHNNILLSYVPRHSTTTDDITALPTFWLLYWDCFCDGGLIWLVPRLLCKSMLICLDPHDGQHPCPASPLQCPTTMPIWRHLSTHHRHCNELLIRSRDPTSLGCPGSSYLQQKVTTNHASHHPTRLFCFSYWHFYALYTIVEWPLLYPALIHNLMQAARAVPSSRWQKNICIMLLLPSTHPQSKILHAILHTSSNRRLINNTTISEHQRKRGDKKCCPYSGLHINAMAVSVPLRRAKRVRLTTPTENLKECVCSRTQWIILQERSFCFAIILLFGNNCTLN